MTNIKFHTLRCGETRRNLRERLALRSLLKPAIADTQHRADSIVIRGRFPCSYIRQPKRRRRILSRIPSGTILKSPAALPRTPKAEIERQNETWSINSEVTSPYNKVSTPKPAGPGTQNHSDRKGSTDMETHRENLKKKQNAAGPVRPAWQESTEGRARPLPKNHSLKVLSCRNHIQRIS